MLKAAREKNYPYDVLMQAGYCGKHRVCEIATSLIVQRTITLCSIGAIKTALENGRW